MLDFERGLCSDLSISGTREWLVTNGIGGYASGTIAGLLTRRYHGVLVAALNPPMGRTLLVTKVEETVDYDGHTYKLYTNRWAGGHIDPNGHIYLERFYLEGTTPVWVYACADALIEKRIWMRQGENTTDVHYTLTRATRPLMLSVKTLVNYRDHHNMTRAGNWQMLVTPIEHGLKIDAYFEATPFYLFCNNAQSEPQHLWNRDFFLSIEDSRGFAAYEDNLSAGLFYTTLQPGESLTLVATTQASVNLDDDTVYTERQEYEKSLLTQSKLDAAPEGIRQLVIAADQFIVKRRLLPTDEEGRSIIAGYPWFGDWGRDTMIALPGLTLTTGRFDVARRILRTFANYIDQGMLPNRFPDAGEQPEYNTIDATLWYFEALRAYLAATNDTDLIRELFPYLTDIVDWHQRGTRYNIHVDPADGLLYGGEAGVQLTWMDAKVGDWVVTPRIGKPVEISALWYNAQFIMADFARKLRKPYKVYDEAAERTRTGFARYWNEAKGYCYDVLDAPYGHDEALRPNQLLAVSLPHSALTSEQQRAVVDVCSRRLLTSHGLRSLATDDIAYVGYYGGDARQRDGAYHQGTVWAWLIGPFVSAFLRVYGDAVQAERFLRPLIAHLGNHGVGSISEIFDGDAPFPPNGCFAQAWSVAEILRVWQEIAQSTTMKERKA